MSEHSIIMPSQLSSNPADVTLASTIRPAPGEPIQASSTVKSKPRFAEFACSYAQVCPVPLEERRREADTLKGLSLCDFDDQGRFP